LAKYTFVIEMLAAQESFKRIVFQYHIKYWFVYIAYKHKVYVSMLTFFAIDRDVTKFHFIIQVVS